MGTRSRFGLQLLAVLTAGAAVHGLVIALTPGEYWDMLAIRTAGAAFADAPLHVYVLNVTLGGHYQGVPAYVWPYLPAYLPIAGLLHWITVHIGSTVSHLDRAVISLADLALAWLLQWGLGRLGRSRAERLLAAGLVALGPCFVAVSGVHGQLDSLAWLPAVGGYLVWIRRRLPWHALAAGALIGLGVDVKTTPGLLLLALALDARSRRELALLLAGAAAVVAVSLAPYALTTTSGLSAIVHYSGFPGRGGLTALLQPRLVLHQFAVGNPNVRFDATTHFLLAHGSVIVGIALLAVLVCGWWRRLSIPDLMAALILTMFVFAPAVLPQYWLWIVPFLILGGRLRTALLYELAMTPLLLANYAFLQEPTQPARHLPQGVILYGYVPALWVVTLVMLAALVTLLVSGGDAPIRLPAARRGGLSVPSRSRARAS